MEGHPDCAAQTAGSAVAHNPRGPAVPSQLSVRSESSRGVVAQRVHAAKMAPGAPGAQAQLEEQLSSEQLPAGEPQLGIKPAGYQQHENGGSGTWGWQVGGQPGPWLQPQARQPPSCWTAAAAAGEAGSTGGDARPRPLPHCLRLRPPHAAGGESNEDTGHSGRRYRTADGQSIHGDTVRRRGAAARHPPPAVFAGPFAAASRCCLQRTCLPQAWECTVP